MLKSKKWITLLMAALLLCSMTGCGSEEKEEPAKPVEKGIVSKLGAAVLSLIQKKQNI